MAELRPLDYADDGTALRGWLALPELAGPHPGVLVMHSAHGIRDHERRVAARLAALGYAALVTDMYGVDRHDPAVTAAGAPMMALIKAPDRLRARAAAALAALTARPEVAGKVGVFGYCFGGMCALELARSGAAVAACVSFHGLLGTTAPAAAGAIGGEVAVFTGALDPWAPAADVEALRGELAAAGAAAQITVFGGAAHAFTDRDAAEQGNPAIRYHALADAVSWAAATELLKQTLH